MPPEYPFWPACIECKRHTVNPAEPARYDVLQPAADIGSPDTIGPYCSECWPATYTAQQPPATPAPESDAPIYDAMTREDTLT